jgi:hypothetical protein
MARNIVGPPARGGDFYDREELVELLWNRLERGNVLLAAPRRFGKTSLMFRVLDEPRDNWKIVHVDAESIREPVNFVIAVLAALMEDQQLRRFLLDAWEKGGAWLRDLLSSVEVTTQWDVGVKMDLKERIREDWRERGKALLQVLRDYDADTRLMLIIDELPVMLRLFEDNDISDEETRAFLYWFRSLRNDPEVGLAECRFLIGGSIGIEHSLSRLHANDSLNDFERVALSELSPNTAEAFLDELLDDRDLAPDTECRQLILDLVGAPIPYFIQIFVSELAAVRANGGGALDSDDVETIYHDQVLGSASKTYFQHYYDRLCQYEKRRERAAKVLLKEIAIAQPEPVGRDRLRAIFRQAFGSDASDEDYAALIADLENDFYIRYDRHRDGYSFASKILCDWWRRYYAF